MDGFIVFFRDILSGPLYIVAVIVAIILIFACIGYLAEKSISAKKIASQYMEVDEVVIDNPIVADVSSPASFPGINENVSDNTTSVAPGEALVPDVNPVMENSVNAIQNVPIESSDMESVVSPAVNVSTPEIVSEVSVNQESVMTSTIPEMSTAPVISPAVDNFVSEVPVNQEPVIMSTIPEVSTVSAVSPVVEMPTVVDMPNPAPVVGEVPSSIPEMVPDVSMPVVSMPTADGNGQNS